MSQSHGVRSREWEEGMCRGGNGLAVALAGVEPEGECYFWREKGIISGRRLFNIQSRELVGRGGKRWGIESRNGFDDMVIKQWHHKKSPEHFYIVEIPLPGQNTNYQ